MLTLIIKPQQISSQIIHNEIAKILHIAVTKIKKCEYWQHQLWVNIDGIGGRIISYRSLPTWIHQAILAIKNCGNLEQLQELGNIIKFETQRFSQYYSTEYVQKLRAIWADKRDSLQEKEQLEAPQRQHRQDGIDWLESWTEIISRCHTTASLQHAYFIMEHQSQEFEDLPEIIAQLLKIYQQRWEKLVE